MKLDARAVLAALALTLAACQGGGFDSGGSPGGFGGGMGPPVQQPGPIGSGGEMQGPEIGPNGQPELTAPGSTLAPNQAQYPVGDGPNGMRCPQFQQFECTVSFNMPPPSPTPSPSSSGSSSPKPKATPTPTPTPKPTPTASSSSDDDSDSPTPSPTPPGTITLQMEPLPKDLPPMANPDPRLMRVTPMVAIRLQSDTDFALNGYANVQYTMPARQLTGRSFTVQLYNEGVLRGKRTDQILASYNKSNVQEDTVQFSFAVPKVTVKRGQIWLLALYGYQYPPGTTPTPSPTPASSGSPSPSAPPTPTASP